MVICGDFNARIGNKDSVQHNQFPCIPKRHCVDLISRNSEPFNDFLNDCNLCVLNGRFRQECDIPAYPGKVSQWLTTLWCLVIHSAVLLMISELNW